MTPRIPPAIEAIRNGETWPPVRRKALSLFDTIATVAVGAVIVGCVLLAWVL